MPRSQCTLRMDVQHLLPLVEALNRAHDYTVCIFAARARFGHNMRHLIFCLSIKGYLVVVGGKVIGQRLTLTRTSFSTTHDTRRFVARKVDQTQLLYLIVTRSCL